jgi:hypothetical protein
MNCGFLASLKCAIPGEAASIGSSRSAIRLTSDTAGRDEVASDKSVQPCLRARDNYFYNGSIVDRTSLPIAICVPRKAGSYDNQKINLEKLIDNS